VGFSHYLQVPLWYFNSTLVRLTEEADKWEEGITVFQFHFGAINSGQRSAYREL